MSDGHDDVVDLLAASPVFGALIDDHRRTLAGTLRIRKIVAGEEMFHQGDVADSAYVILSGRLEAIRDAPDGARRIREFVGGDTVGELALLTGGVRTASVRAVRDTVALRLGAREFLSLMEREPSFAVGLAQALAHQVEAATDHAEVVHRRPSVIALVTTADQVGVMLSGLVDAIRTFARAEPFAETSEPDRWAAGVDAIEHTGAVVVLGAVLDASGWTRFCVRQADRVLVVADGGPPPELHLPLDHPDLAVLRPATTRSAWEAALDPVRTFVLDRYRLEATLGRVARRLLGRSIGLALSGGGARGMAHIGVLHELDERGIVVDRIGGTSIGAFIAGMYAKGFPCGQIAQICRSELAERNAFDDYTVPRVAVIRGTKARRMLDRVFGDTAIEDLDMDTFAMSADLASSEPVCHRRGLLRDAVGASMSLPGYAPPFELEGRLLVDGGVLDNLPVGPLVEPWEGPVIAVDVMGRWSYGPDAVRLPRLMETLARATVLGSRSKAVDAMRRATVSITPEVSGTKLFDFSRMDELIETGRQAAAAALDALGSPLG